MSRRLKCTTLHQNKSWQHAPFKMSHGTGTGGGSRTRGVKKFDADARLSIYCRYTRLVIECQARGFDMS